MKVNPDGPSLTLTVEFSTYESSTTIPTHDNSIDIPQNQGNTFYYSMLQWPLTVMQPTHLINK
jgi:hypothetical protein